MPASACASGCRHEATWCPVGLKKAPSRIWPLLLIRSSPRSASRPPRPRIIAPLATDACRPETNGPGERNPHLGLYFPQACPQRCTRHREATMEHDRRSFLKTTGLAGAAAVTGATALAATPAEAQMAAASTATE